MAARQPAPVPAKKETRTSTLDLLRQIERVLEWRLSQPHVPPKPIRDEQARKLLAHLRQEIETRRRRKQQKRGAVPRKPPQKEEF
jgi:hypothetical protein